VCVLTTEPKCFQSLPAICKYQPWYTLKDTLNTLDITYFFSSAALEAAEAAWDGENGPFPPIGGRPGGRKPVKGYRRPPNAALAAPYGDLNIGFMGNPYI